MGGGVGRRTAQKWASAHRLWGSSELSGLFRDVPSPGRLYLPVIGYEPSPKEGTRLGCDSSLGPRAPTPGEPPLPAFVLERADPRQQQCDLEHPA